MLVCIVIIVLSLIYQTDTKEALENESEPKKDTKSKDKKESAEMMDAGEKAIRAINQISDKQFDLKKLQDAFKDTLQFEDDVDQSLSKWNFESKEN